MTRNPYKDVDERRDKQISFHVSEGELKRIELYRVSLPHNPTRSNVLRWLVMAALEREPVILEPKTIVYDVPLGFRHKYRRGLHHVWEKRWTAQKK